MREFGRRSKHHLVISFLILITLSLDCVLILFGESWCWSLLGGLSHHLVPSPHTQNVPGKVRIIFRSSFTLWSWEQCFEWLAFFDLFCTSLWLIDEITFHLHGCTPRFLRHNNQGGSFLNSRIKIKFSLFSAKGESCFLPLVRPQVYDMVWSTFTLACKTEINKTLARPVRREMRYEL